MTNRGFKARVTTRRGFLAAGAGFGLFNLVPSSVFGARAPSNRVTMALIGCGAQGCHEMNGFLRMDDVRVLAVCDVNRLRREYAKRLVDGQYAMGCCRMYADFREVCQRDDIDAVMIATPDHWHAVIGVYAANHGKDIYGEKPFTHDLREGRSLVCAVERNGRVWQTGSWQRSNEEMRRAVELVRNGRIGKVVRVEVGLPDGGRGPAATPGAEIPNGLDWDFWLGPAPERPFEGVCDGHWRWVSDWGGGQVMDWIGHHGDIAQWGLDTDFTGPVSFDGTAPDDRDGIYDTPKNYRIECEYANGVKMVVADLTKVRAGTKWIGEKGDWVWVDRGRYEASSPAIYNSRIEPGEVHLFRSPGHLRNFIDCVKTRAVTLTPAEIAHRSASIGHLCLASIKAGHKLTWNPKTERIMNDSAAERYLSRPLRSPWRL